MNTQYTADYWIEKLELQPHPEGGFYKEIHRSKVILERQALPSRFRGDRVASTSIYFLLKGNNFSAFHRIRSEEGWHYYAGNTSLTVHELKTNGIYTQHKLGADFENGEQFFSMIEAESWFATEPNDKSEESYALVGCTVAPGFHFDDFELAEANSLRRIYKSHRELIERLCVK